MTKQALILLRSEAEERSDDDPPEEYIWHSLTAITLPKIQQNWRNLIHIPYQNRIYVKADMNQSLCETITVAWPPLKQSLWCLTDRDRQNEEGKNRTNSKTGNIRLLPLFQTAQKRIALRQFSVQRCFVG